MAALLGDRQLALLAQVLDLDEVGHASHLGLDVPQPDERVELGHHFGQRPRGSGRGCGGRCCGRSRSRGLWRRRARRPHAGVVHGLLQARAKLVEGHELHG